MSEPTCGIYSITGPRGTVYIGSAEDIPRRWKSHRSQLRAGRHHNRLLQAAWTAAGEGAFAFSVVEGIASAADLVAAEQRHLDTAITTGPVYNLAMDIRTPARGLIHTAESRAKMSAAILASMTPEHREARRLRIQGEQNPAVKLAETQVRQICAHLLAGAHPAALAAELGVVQETIYQIRSGRIWTHVVDAETVAAMKAIRQNPWADGTRQVTQADRDRFAAVGRSNKGRKPSAANSAVNSARYTGAGNPKAKLTDDGVREIKRRAAAGERNMDLAAEFGIHPNSVSKIKSGATWAHIT